MSLDLTEQDPVRAALEARWLDLTRVALPQAAKARQGWPVRFDHCFQRILLDAACNGRWYDHIAGRPAYMHAPDAVLLSATRLGEAVLAGEADLTELNQQSLRWRGKSRTCTSVS